MIRAYKYRLYPTEKQCVLIDKHISTVRLIYNLALETKQTAFYYGKNLSRFDLQKQLPDLKNEFIWMKEVSAQSLQASLLNLEKAYVNFFNGKCDFPKFKKKSNTGSFLVPQDIRVDTGCKIYIPKFREGIKLVKHRNYNGVVKQAVISKTSTGKFFVSLICDDMNETINNNTTSKKSVGIDLGITTFAVLSDGTNILKPKDLHKSQTKLKYLQSKFSKFKGKRNRIKINRLYEKITNKKKDFLHKTSRTIINNHDIVAVETLNVKGMLKNRNLSKAISESGWSMFLDMLTYKSEFYNKTLIKVGMFSPTSKMCSVCGNVKQQMSLNQRVYKCECGLNIDRDLNAAINIKNIALNGLRNID